MRPDRVDELGGDRLALCLLLLDGRMRRDTIRDGRVCRPLETVGELPFSQSVLCSSSFLATILDLGLRASLAFGATGGESVVNDSFFGTIMFELR